MRKSGIDILSCQRLSYDLNEWGWILCDVKRQLGCLGLGIVNKRVSCKLQIGWTLPRYPGTEFHVALDGKLQEIEI